MPHTTSMSVKLACTLHVLRERGGYVPDHVLMFRVGLLPGELRDVRRILFMRGLCKRRDYHLCITDLGASVLDSIVPSILVAEENYAHAF